MKSLIFTLLTSLFLFACQNSGNQTAPASSAPADANAAVAISPEVIQAAYTKAKANLDKINQVMEAARAAKTGASAAQQAELDQVIGELEGGIEKQAMLTSGLELAATPNNPNAPTLTVLEDYLKSVDSYIEFAGEMEKKIKEIKGKH